MTIKINVSNEIIEKVNNNTLKAKEIVSYILLNVPNSSTNFDIDKTSLRDIIFSGKNIKSAKFDGVKRVLLLEV